jgi:hypothetical protein
MGKADQVRLFLRETDLATVRVTDAAKAIGHPSGRIRNYLTRENISFPALLEEERKRRFMKLLEVNKTPDLALVNKVTGYTHTNSSARAVVRWLGMTLREHNKRARR